VNSLFALIPIAFVLSLDNFQSSIGLGTTKPPWRRIVQAAIVFSACDALAPLIGVWVGNVLGQYIGDVAEYIGAAALGAYALYLVVHALRTEEAGDLDHPLAILGLPLPLSLDNLFAGASLGVVGASPVTVAVVCGCATLVMSMVGLTLGRLAASKVRIRTDLFGGLVLMGMAVLMVVRVLSPMRRTPRWTATLRVRRATTAARCTHRWTPFDIPNQSTAMSALAAGRCLLATRAGTCTAPARCTNSEGGHHDSLQVSGGLGRPVRRRTAWSPSGVPGQCLSRASGPARRAAERRATTTTMASSA